MRKGFTLLELLIVVIVIGILATIAIPQFLTSLEKARVGKAKNALGLISHALKMHRAEYDSYVNATIGVNGTLHNYIDLHQVDADDDWGYAITNASATTFIVTATKNATGAYGGEAITLDENGTCAGNHTLRGPDCGG